MNSENHSILIKNGRIITVASDSIGDIYIKGGVISAIGLNLEFQADRVIDANGLLIFPGGIDPHVHLEMPFMGTFSCDTYESGTAAAVHGGTTTVIDFAIQKQGGTLQTAVDEWEGRAKNNCYADYAFHAAVTDFNENVSEEVPNMIQQGITSFKIFMAYKNALMTNDYQRIALMERVKQFGGIVTVHATNGDMIDYLVQKFKKEGKTAPIYHYLSQPELTEAEATSRFVDQCHQTGCNGYVVHVTCEGALQHLRNCQNRNQKVGVETCIQYLTLDASVYENENEGAKWVMSPPLRQEKDKQALWAGIQQGQVHTLASDHCPFQWSQKLLGQKDFSKIPNGCPIIEHRFELFYSEGVVKGKIDLQKFVEITSTNSAKIFGMFPKKGTISIGSDADLVLFNPNEIHQLSKNNHHMNVDYSCYEGWQVQGKTKIVLIRGQVALEDGKITIPKGYGQYIKRSLPYQKSQ